MALFGKGNSGGTMNVIRCDQPQYLVWKWRPEGQPLGASPRENAIRFGSSLRVRAGEVAVFVYKRDNGQMLDFIEGPFDDIIRTNNFPVLASIVGMAYGGNSPFQAEVYFINLQQNNQLRFAVPYFDVFDPRLPDHPVPLAVRGMLTFNITDYRNFIKLVRLIDFDLNDFYNQIISAVSKYVKAVVMDAPSQLGIFAVQIERKILQINDLVMEHVRPRLENDFGVNVRGLDIDALDIDKDSEGYKAMHSLTAGQTAQAINVQNEVARKNLRDMQRINADNMEETLRIQREEAQRAQRLQSETNFMGAHVIDQQAAVLGSMATSMGQSGAISGDGSGMGMNPAGMMTGMMVGGAMGQQLAGMMGSLGQQSFNAMNTPPPMPGAQYMISVGGQASGPYSIPQLQSMAMQGTFTPQTYVWKQGMAQWEFAGNVPELGAVFMPPPPQGMPGMPTPP